MTTIPDLGDDASTQLEELLGDSVAQPLDGLLGEGNTRLVQLVGPHLRLAGAINTGAFRRLTDLVNNLDGLVHVRDATVLRRNGDPTKVAMPDVWVAPPEVTLIAEVDPAPQSPTPEWHLAKVQTGLIVVTPGHTLTGFVHLAPGAMLTSFVESPDPAFLPMTDVRTRSLADRRVISRYPFALLNRRHIVAASPLPAGFVDGRRVL